MNMDVNTRGHCVNGDEKRRSGTRLQREKSDSRACGLGAVISMKKTAALRRIRVTLTNGHRRDLMLSWSGITRRDGRGRSYFEDSSNESTVNT